MTKPKHAADAQLKALVLELQVIAEHNDDEFDCALTYNQAEGGFVFKCWEKADKHDFVEGYGVTIASALDFAAGSIAEACEAWGYEQP